MFDYLQKYKNVPKEVRDKISTPEILASIENLEKKYGVNLATVVMKVMTKDLGVNKIPEYLSDNFKLDERNSGLLSREMEADIFSAVYDYLGIGVEEKTYLSEADYENKNEEAPAVKGDSFLFSSEDEKEIKELADKINQHEKKTTSEDLDDRLDKIVKNAQINFGSDLLAGRFANILKTYLKGIRGRIEAKQALIKPVKSGGLDFDPESAEQVLKIADGDFSEKVNIKIEPPRIIKVPEDYERIKSLKRIGARDIDYDFSALKKKTIEKLDIAHELAPPPPVLRETVKAPVEARGEIKKESTKSIDFNEVKRKPEFEKTPVQPTISALKPVVKKAESIGAGGKVKIEDVKFKPRIMGPIDELRYMNLINFRRLGEDSLQVIEKIKEKINLLEGEYSKKVEGIKAWRLSPINRLYLEMGAESINNGQPVDAIISKRRKEGKDYLDEKEFEAIISLNKSLRF